MFNIPTKVKGRLSQISMSRVYNFWLKNHYRPKHDGKNNACDQTNGKFPHTFKHTHIHTHTCTRWVTKFLCTEWLIILLPSGLYIFMFFRDWYLYASTHAHTSIHRHTHLHTCLHTHIRTSVGARTHTHTLSLAHAHTRTYTYLNNIQVYT